MEKEDQEMILENALNNLNILIHSTNGLAHPQDQSRTVDFFIFLKEKSINYDVEEIKNWLVQKGWKNHYAKEVAEIAKRIKEGKEVIKKCQDPPFFNEKHYEKWTNKINNNKL